jgi:hypothetical protein
MANLSNINNVLRVSSNLRVGINTDAASYALEIGGTNSGIKLKNSGGSGKVYSILSDTSGNFQIYDDAAGDGRLVINDIGNATFSGNVKIGTSTTGTPAVNADDLVIDKGASESGITLMSTAAASIRFGDAANTSIGSLEYNHNSNYMRMIVNNAEVVRIDSSGNVGVGTETIPTYWSGYTALQLGADNSIFSNTATGSGSAIFIGQNIYNDGSDYRYTGAASNEAGLLDMRSGLFRFYNAPNGSAGSVATMSQRLTVGLNGNFGIGTGNDPVAPLEVTGNSTNSFLLNPIYGIGQNIFFNGSAWDSVNHSVGGSIIQLGNDGSFAFRRATAANPPVLSYSMYIDSSGKVGINAIDPVKTLDVRGSLAISNSTASYWYIDRNDATGNFDLNENTNGTLFSVSTNGLGSFVNTSIGDKLLLAGDNAASARGLMFNCSTTTNQGDTWDIDAQSVTGIIKFSTGSSEKMRITSSGLTIFKSSFVAAGSYGGELNIGGSSVTTFGLQAKYNQGGATQSTLYSSPGYTSNDQLFLLGAGAGNTSQLVLRGNGRVGIGTTSPLTKLHIEGPNNNDGNDYAQLYIKGTGTYPLDIAGIVLDSAGSNQSHIRFHNNGTPKVQIRYNEGGNAVDKLGVYSFVLGSNIAEFNNGTGDFVVKGDVTAYGSPSDKRLKENIKPIESALDKASKLQGVTFDWKEKGITNLKEDIGFIAQDVQKIIPELVRENQNGMLSMRHQGIAPILLEAIKELKAEIEGLKNKLCACNNCNCKE